MRSVRYGAFVRILSVVVGCVVPRVFSPTAQLVVIDAEIVATYFGVYFFSPTHSLLSLKSNAKL